MTKLASRKMALGHRENNKGFSLIELIIVITIMAVLTAILAPQLLRYVEQSRVARDLTTIDEVHRAIQISLADEKVYTATGTGHTVTLAPDGLITATGNSALADDLHRTLGGTHTAGQDTLTLKNKLVSNAYKSTTVTYTINISTDGVITVTNPLNP